MELVKIGNIKKPFGVAGHLKYEVKDVFLDDFSRADVVFLKKSDGDIPFFVLEVNDGNPPTVLLEDVQSKELASKISMCDILLRPSDISAAESEESDSLLALVGYRLYDKERDLGVINDIVEFPQQIMASLTIKQSNILIPLPPNFIVEVDHQGRKLLCDLPDGIVESQI